jgi:hypothetical protein
MSLFHAFMASNLWHDSPQSNLLDGAALEPQFFAKLLEGSASRRIAIRARPIPQAGPLWRRTSPPPSRRARAMSGLRRSPA